MDFTAEVFCGEPVSEFVDDLDDCKTAPEVDNGSPVEERLEVGQSLFDFREVTDHHRQCRKHQQAAQDDECSCIDPLEVGVHPCQQAFRIDDRNLDVKDVGGSPPDLLPNLLPATFDEDFGLFRSIDLSHAGFVKLGAEPDQVVHGDGLRPILAFERLFDLQQGGLAVELLEQEILFSLEPVIFQADGVFDDIVGHALIKLRTNHQVGPETNPQGFAGLTHWHVRCDGWSTGHVGVSFIQAKSIGMEIRTLRPMDPESSHPHEKIRSAGNASV